MDGAALVQGMQCALVAVISCFIPGQKMDWEALDIMVVDPE